MNRRFAEKYVALCLERVKHDGRTKEAVEAHRRAQMQLAMASDNDLTNLAKYEFRLFGFEVGLSWEEILKRLIERRQRLRSRDSFQKLFCLRCKLYETCIKDPQTVSICEKLVDKGAGGLLFQSFQAIWP